MDIQELIGSRYNPRDNRDSRDKDKDHRNSRDSEDYRNFRDSRDNRQSLDEKPIFELEKHLTMLPPPTSSGKKKYHDDVEQFKSPKLPMEMAREPYPATGTSSLQLLSANVKTANKMKVNGDEEVGEDEVPSISEKRQLTDKNSLDIGE